MGPKWWGPSCRRSKLSMILQEDTALLPIITRYQLSPPMNKMLIFQKWPHIWKAICCVFVLFTMETVSSDLLDLECIFYQIVSL